MSTEERQHKQGQCFRLSAEYILECGDLTPALMVHGTVVGQVGLVRDIRYPHAWVEIMADNTRWVIDLDWCRRLGMDPKDRANWIPADLYMVIGKAARLVTYDKDETLQALAINETWGPWLASLQEVQDAAELQVLELKTCGCSNPTPREVTSMGDEERHFVCAHCTKAWTLPLEDPS